MTDPRIEAAITEMKRLFGSGECVDRAEWSACAECILAAADAAAWRPIESAPKNTNILTYYPDGRVAADRFPYRGMLEWQEEIDAPPTHWHPLPVPPASSDALGGVDG